jgi:hypothetical protein
VIFIVLIFRDLVVFDSALYTLLFSAFVGGVCFLSLAILFRVRAYKQTMNLFKVG